MKKLSLLSLFLVAFALVLAGCGSGDDKKSTTKATTKKVDADDDGNGLIDISTIAQLKNIKNNLDGTSYKTSATGEGDASGCPEIGTGTAKKATCKGYELDNDIAFTGDTSNFASIVGFTGIFDGGNKEITGLVIGGDSVNTGFFADSSGTIKNLSIVGATVSSTSTAANSTVGVLVGNNTGTVENSSATATTAVGSVTGNASSLGGLVGYNGNGGTIQNSFASVSVTGGAAANSVGGLVGKNTSGTIQNTFATGNVVGGAGVDQIGGLLGELVSGTVTNSFSFLGTVDGGAGDDLVSLFIGKVAASDVTVTGNYFDSTTDKLVADSTGTDVSLAFTGVNGAIGKSGTELKAVAAGGDELADASVTVATATEFVNGTGFKALNWDFTADKYLSLKSFKVNASNAQIAGDLLCNQPTDFVQCTTN